MTRQYRVDVFKGWSLVGKWTLFGTLTCIAVAVAFNALVFADLGEEALNRSILSATALPILIAVPLFLLLGLRLRRLSATNRRLGLVARTDSLTECLNRGAFTTQVDDILSDRSAAKRGALLIIDADNFKSINDLFGHDAGDKALTVIAGSIRTILRPQDLLGRMGGEEFGVYLPEADEHGAAAIAERIRRSVNLSAFAPEGTQYPLSVSIGGVAFDGQAGFSDLFRIADQRLYSAKRTGRNRVAITHLSDHPTICRMRRA